MPKVAISADFLAAFSRIPRTQQKKVREFTEKFRADPTMASINYERLAQMRDDKVRSVRIGIDYRAIVIHPPRGDVYLLVWVDHHDEAMAWARNKRFDVNARTGALQVVDVEQAEILKQEEAPPESPAEPRVEASPPAGLFAELDDPGLLSVGLPEVLLPSVRALEDDVQLDKLRDHLPEEVYEALFMLAAGATVEEALKEAQKQPDAPVDTDSFEQALQHPDSKRRFQVVDSSGDLLEMLNAPLERWRVFLHPDQRKLVRRRFNGPARVLGGAGTGKTVVAMHRARHLSREVFNAPTDRILFTTFTANLANNLQHLLASMCGPEMERIEVVHLDSWAVRHMRSNDIVFKIANETQRADCWQDAFAAVDPGNYDEAFYRAEWEHVVQFNGITTRQDYFRTPRIGRTSRLPRGDKVQVWELMDEYRRALRGRSLMEWPDVIRETRLYLQNNPGTLPYRAIVVDEAQDLHPEHWKLLRTLSPEGEGIHDNLFIVGDAHQRIYGRKLVLGRLGINIRGRAARLKINYRTTEAIRRWSTALLEGVEIDDLDDGLDTTAGYKSIRDGVEPEVRAFDTLEQEQTFITDRIKSLTATTEPQSICLVARTRRQLTQDYIPALEKAGIEHTLLDKKTDTDDGPGIRLATMHRVKGLEFAHMILAGINQGQVPLVRDEGLASGEVQARERCLLYVAATRARDSLLVVCGSIASQLLEGLMG